MGRGGGAESRGIDRLMQPLPRSPSPPRVEGGVRSDYADSVAAYDPGSNDEPRDTAVAEAASPSIAGSDSTALADFGQEAALDTQVADRAASPPPPSTEERQRMPVQAKAEIAASASASLAASLAAATTELEPEPASNASPQTTPSGWGAVSTAVRKRAGRDKAGDRIYQLTQNLRRMERKLNIGNDAYLSEPEPEPSLPSEGPGDGSAVEEGVPPMLPTPDRGNIADNSTFREATQASLGGQWVTAAGEYERFLAMVPRSHPDYGSSLADLAGCYAQLGDFRRAEDAITRCLSLYAGNDTERSPQDEQVRH